MSGHAIEDIQDALLGRLCHGLDRFSVDDDVGEQGSGRHVVVPDRVMHDLVVPFALARLQIDAHETVAEEVVAGTVAAVEIRRRILDG